MVTGGLGGPNLLGYKQDNRPGGILMIPSVAFLKIGTGTSGGAHSPA